MPSQEGVFIADLHSTVASGLGERYRMLAETVRELAKSLSDDQFWSKPFPFGNSFGHLILHLTGNLNYYIGSEVSGSGYVRDRDREFSEKDRPSKADVMKRFDQTIEMVLQTIASQQPDDWSKNYTAVREEEAGNRFNILLRCCTHLHHHIGQMTYLVNGAKSLAA